MPSYAEIQYNDCSCDIARVKPITDHCTGLKQHKGGGGGGGKC